MNEQKITLWGYEEPGPIEKNAEDSCLALNGTKNLRRNQDRDDSTLKSYEATAVTTLGASCIATDEYCSLFQLGVRCDIRSELLNELVDKQVIYADGPDANLYSSIQLTRLQAACRLIKAFELEASAVAIAVLYAERIEHLEKRVNWLKLTCLDAQTATRQ